MDYLFGWLQKGQFSFAAIDYGVCVFKVILHISMYILVYVCNLEEGRIYVCVYMCFDLWFVTGQV